MAPPKKDICNEIYGDLRKLIKRDEVLSYLSDFVTVDMWNNPELVATLNTHPRLCHTLPYEQGAVMVFVYNVYLAKFAAKRVVSCFEDIDIGMQLEKNLQKTCKVFIRKMLAQKSNVPVWAKKHTFTYVGGLFIESIIMPFKQEVNTFNDLMGKDKLHIARKAINNMIMLSTKMRAPILKPEDERVISEKIHKKFDESTAADKFAHFMFGRCKNSEYDMWFGSLAHPAPDAKMIPMDDLNRRQRPRNTQKQEDICERVKFPILEDLCERLQHPAKYRSVGKTKRPVPITRPTRRVKEQSLEKTTDPLKQIPKETPKQNPEKQPIEQPIDVVDSVTYGDHNEK